MKKEYKPLNLVMNGRYAVMVGTSQSRISEYIRGAVVPSLGVDARICKELHIDPKVFVEDCCQCDGYPV